MAGGGAGFLLLPLLLLLAGALPPGAPKELYSPQDPLALLDSRSLPRALNNSASAWLLEFYSSWCGHCVQYAPTWRVLAGDVKDWEPVIKIGVLDCANEVNTDVCKQYGIQYYPSFRFFKAFTKEFTQGENYKSGAEHDVQTVRQVIIDFLQNSPAESKPPACPSLAPIESSQVESLIAVKESHYTAVIYESPDSYIGREVILDFVQYEGLVVKRALDTDKEALQKLGIVSVPSCYLIYPNGTHGLINNLEPLRSLFSSHLKSLPGVRKKTLSRPELTTKPTKPDKMTETWKEFDKSKMYMADLESGLHYLLRVEVATHQMLKGDELKAFKDFITILYKLFPGRPHVARLLETLQDWLVSMPLDKIPYDAILDLVNNKMQISGIYLTSHVQWVGCQGSEPGLRGYPCSLWKLFHTLTVQAALQPNALTNTAFEGNSQAVLQTMRQYIKHFFGCRECAGHFESMAKESMDDVKTLKEAVLWLWSKHNKVNKRLAGAASEDVKSPKVDWPTPDMCPACHGEVKGVHNWNEEEVLVFLKKHYGSKDISLLYSDPNNDRIEVKIPPFTKPPGHVTGDKKDPKHGLKSDTLDKLVPDHLDKNKDGELGAGHKDLKLSSFLGLGFSNIDMSLCVVLYITSTLFLMIMYFFFKVRSRRWKVRYNRPYV
ncbi:sulfhydryl oxidase 2 isoform X1 [Pelobates cultripes]|nr:sulfhydryl oxidase 2 isoform X1 [Pelobates cultripes]